MDFDDLDPKHKAAKLKDLTALSEDDLTSYIASLKSEIARAESALENKAKQKNAASFFFKTPA